MVTRSAVRRLEERYADQGRTKQLDTRDFGALVDSAPGRRVYVRQNDDGAANSVLMTRPDNAIHLHGLDIRDLV